LKTDLDVASSSDKLEIADRLELQLFSKQVHVIGEAMRTCRINGLKSNNFAIAYDEGVHFLSLPPTAINPLPQWMKRGRYELRTSECENARGFVNLANENDLFLNCGIMSVVDATKAQIEMLRDCVIAKLQNGAGGGMQCFFEGYAAANAFENLKPDAAEDLVAIMGITLAGKATCAGAVDKWLGRLQMSDSATQALQTHPTGRDFIAQVTVRRNMLEKIEKDHEQRTRAAGNVSIKLGICVKEDKKQSMTIAEHVRALAAAVDESVNGPGRRGYDVAIFESTLPDERLKHTAEKGREVLAIAAKAFALCGVWHCKVSQDYTAKADSFKVVTDFVGYLLQAQGAFQKEYDSSVLEALNCMRTILIEIPKFFAEGTVDDAEAGRMIHIANNLKYSFLCISRLSAFSPEQIAQQEEWLKLFGVGEIASKRMDVFGQQAAAIATAVKIATQTIHNLSDLLGDEAQRDAFLKASVGDSNKLVLKQFAQRIQNDTVRSQVDIVFASHACVVALVKHHAWWAKLELEKFHVPDEECCLAVADIQNSVAVLSETVKAYEDAKKKTVPELFAPPALRDRLLVECLPPSPPPSPPPPPLPPPPIPYFLRISAVPV